MYLSEKSIGERGGEGRVSFIGIQRGDACDN